MTIYASSDNKTLVLVKPVTEQLNCVAFADAEYIASLSNSINKASISTDRTATNDKCNYINVMLQMMK